MLGGKTPRDGASSTRSCVPPATSYAVIVTIPNGSKVEVLKKYTGEAILKNQPTWYLVNWRTSSGTVIQGYVYGPLVKLTS